MPSAATGGDRRPRAIEIDIRNHRKDGTPFWNRLLMAPVRNARGELAYFFASQLDVTLERERLAALESENAALTAERRADQARLEFSEESLRLATEAAEIGTWDLDLFTDVLTWSDRTKAMFGISPDVPCSMADFYAGLHPDDRDATGRGLRLRARSDPARHLRRRIPHDRQGGRPRPLGRGQGAGHVRRDRPMRAGARHRHRHHRPAAGGGGRARQRGRLRFLDALGRQPLRASMPMRSWPRQPGWSPSTCSSPIAPTQMWIQMKMGSRSVANGRLRAHPAWSGITASLASVKLVVRELTAGEPLIIKDKIAELKPEEAAAFDAVGIRATICMPLVKDSRLTALMAIHDRVPGLGRTMTWR